MIDQPRVFRELTVSAVIDLTPGTRRVTLAGDQLRSFTTGTGIVCDEFVTRSADDHVTVFPRPPGEVTEIAPMYTVRRFDPRGPSLDIDVVLNGHGRGSQWAATATVGDTVHIADPQSSIEHRLDRPRLVFIGDDRAMPAIARFFEQVPDPRRAMAVIAAAENNHCYPLNQGQVIWIETVCGTGARRSSDDVLLDKVRTLRLADGDEVFVWAACEFSLATRLRAVLHTELGLADDQVFVTHYWRRRDADGATAA